MSKGDVSLLIQAANQELQTGILFLNSQPGDVGFATSL